MTSKINWIRSQLLPNEAASEAASRLNTPIKIDNPTPQNKISTPVDVDGLWAIVPATEAFKVLNTFIWDRVLMAIEKQDKALMQNYITALVAGGCLTPATAGKVAVALSGEIPDPNWQAKIIITPSKLAGYSTVLVDEVQEALDNEKTA